MGAPARPQNRFSTSYLNSAPFLPVIWHTISLLPKKIVWRARGRAVGVRCARSGIFLHLWIYFINIFNLFQWSTSQNSCFKVAYVVKKHIFARCGRAGRAKRKFSIDPSFLGQDGSNELSHAQIRTPGCKNYRTKHLLLYRYKFFWLKIEMNKSYSLLNLVFFSNRPGHWKVVNGHLCYFFYILRFCTLTI